MVSDFPSDNFVSQGTEDMKSILHRTREFIVEMSKPKNLKELSSQRELVIAGGELETSARALIKEISNTFRGKTGGLIPLPETEAGDRSPRIGQL